MCGRFTLTVDNLASLAEQLGIVATPEQIALHRPRYNIAPGDACWLVRSRDGLRELILAHWGLVNHWAKDRSIGYKQINARAETLAERPAFRDAFRSRRCVVLADGFYEWRGPRGQREPLWFHAPDRGPLFLAGLHESWTAPASGSLQAPAGERLRTFTIVTTAPNALVRPIHDRMPLILGVQDLDRWLLGDDPASLLRPAPDDALLASPASPRVNRVEHDDPDLLDPDDPRISRQMGLF
jgi:putative SOS response-associated peptidase YedK